MNPYSQSSNFVDLLNSQQDSILPEPYPYSSFAHVGEVASSQLPVFSTQCTETSSFCEDSPTERRERKKWIVIIDHKIKFNIHHAWEELRNDQKWSDLASSKIDGSSKKRKCDDGAQSESSQATTNLGDQPTKRPPGVKAAKGGSSKRNIADHQAVSEFQTMWSIKEKDLAVKERLSKMRLLDSLISKKRATF